MGSLYAVFTVQFWTMRVNVLHIRTWCLSTTCMRTDECQCRETELCVSRVSPPATRASTHARPSPVRARRRQLLSSSSEVGQNLVLHARHIYSWFQFVTRSDHKLYKKKIFTYEILNKILDSLALLVLIASRDFFNDPLLPISHSDIPCSLHF